ncbi:hypothetical protein [Streptomyces sp. NPDC058955]|uniref:hypothetical protein n=1 Tax=unclassified Streptomyces TaxID=2593676 RepID=UPI003648861D
MNALTTLAAAAADWDRLAPLLPPPARSELRDRLAELRAAADAPATAESAAADAVRVLLGALPDPESARLRRHGAPDADGARFTAHGGTPPSARVHGYAALDLCLLVVDGNPMVGPLLGPVRDRLLAAPAQPADPGAGSRSALHPGLIVLTRPDGGRQVPAFQYASGVRPWAVVLEVNALLGAATDPWGAADWWLSANAWTGGAPAALLGRGRDPELTGAARTLGEG